MKIDNKEIEQQSNMLSENLNAGHHQDNELSSQGDTQICNEKWNDSSVGKQVISSNGITNASLESTGTKSNHIDPNSNNHNSSNPNSEASQTNSNYHVSNSMTSTNSSYSGYREHHSSMPNQSSTEIWPEDLIQNSMPIPKSMNVSSQEHNNSQPETELKQMEKQNFSNGVCPGNGTDVSNGQEARRTVAVDGNEKLLTLLEHLKLENIQLKTSLKQTSNVNDQWRNYHDERQRYIQRLKNTITELQGAAIATISTDVASGNPEVGRLKKMLVRLREEHSTHLNLLQKQVRAYQDDWEAERSDKRATEISLSKTEIQLSIVTQQFNSALQKIDEYENRLRWCTCHNLNNCLKKNREEQIEKSPKFSDDSRSSSMTNSRSPSSSLSIESFTLNSPPLRKHRKENAAASSLSPQPVTSPSFCSDTVRKRRNSQSLSNLNGGSSPLFKLGSQCSINNSEVSSRSSSIPSQEIYISESEMSDASKSRIDRHCRDPLFIRHKENENGSTGRNFSGSHKNLEKHTKENSQPNKSETKRSEHKESGSGSILNKNEFKNVNAAKIQKTDSIANISNISSIKKKSFESASNANTDTRGARPKNLDLTMKTGEYDEIILDPKLRARSILASALPHSPSSPSSPPFPKGFNIPKGYIPITSTVLTPVKFRPPFVAHKINKSPSPSSKLCLETKREKQSVKGDKSGNSSKSRKNGCPNGNEVKREMKVNEKLMYENGNWSSYGISKDKEDIPLNYRNTAEIEVYNCKKRESGISEEDLGYEGNKKEANKENNKYLDNENKNKKHVIIKESEVDIADQTKTDTSSKPVKYHTSDHSSTNVSNTNYASITVMPSPSTARRSQGQQTSSSSSGASSPGISLTTFALSADGKGVPGAICFALGSEGRNEKNELQPCSEQRSISPSYEQIKSVQRSESNSECNDCIDSNRLINSAYVKLSENENGGTRMPSGNTCRTARAVPGHEITKKTSQEEKNLQLPYDEAQGRNSKSTSPNVFNSFSFSVNGSPSSFSPENENPRQNYESRYQKNISPPVNIIPFSFSSSSSFVPYNEQCNIFSSSSIETHKAHESRCSQSHRADKYGIKESKNDLRVMASRNISSAILNYEHGSCSPTSHESASDQSIEYSRRNENYLNKRKTMQHHLICSKCQMLFSVEQTRSLEHHMKVCGGPEYADL